MKAEAQRIAIAEACGWTEISTTRFASDGRLWGVANGHLGVVPDYLNDLNAMHEAEKILKDYQKNDYAHALHTARTGGRGVFATAAQRAHAFYQTLNL